MKQETKQKVQVEKTLIEKFTSSCLINLHILKNKFLYNLLKTLKTFHKKYYLIFNLINGTFFKYMNSSYEIFFSIFSIRTERTKLEIFLLITKTSIFFYFVCMNFYRTLITEFHYLVFNYTNFLKF